MSGAGQVLGAIVGAYGIGAVAWLVVGDGWPPLIGYLSGAIAGFVLSGNGSA